MRKPLIVLFFPSRTYHGCSSLSISCVLYYIMSMIPIVYLYHRPYKDGFLLEREKNYFLSKFREDLGKKIDCQFHP